jgi:hypothetical protein
VLELDAGIFGGDVTSTHCALCVLAPELNGKRQEILMAAVPGAQRKE